MEVLAKSGIMEAGSDFWSVCFAFPGWSQRHIDGVIATMAVGPLDIYSGRLPVSRAFFRDVEGGAVTILRSSPTPFTFGDALRILAVIGTYSRVARMPYVRMRRGAWIRSRRTDGTVAAKYPIMPLRDLEVATGLDEITLRAILHPFMRDGAIGIVPDIGTGSGVVLRDGFIDDDGIRRMLDT